MKRKESSHISLFLKTRKPPKVYGFVPCKSLFWGDSPILSPSWLSNQAFQNSRSLASFRCFKDFGARPAAYPSANKQEECNSSSEGFLLLFFCRSMLGRVISHLFWSQPRRSTQNQLDMIIDLLGSPDSRDSRRFGSTCDPSCSIGLGHGPFFV